MMQPRNRKICLLAIVGIVLLASHCNSHQMNISNTWTLPQDGFTVFYRFFRDKISWYEADAVCQFHHANLVTVDNGVKYDASRAYLSDLNVTENVWIGLMRSQNSDRFMWSNSKILDREFGYWAEQIPTIDSPLCAVVDPIRDYRWHSLRCGGPDVASFLCEMEAPEWATECLIRALPSLTIQYIADSATIELSRDCGVEGIKRLTCNGKQDQDSIQRELMCISEQENVASDNEMKIASVESPPELEKGPQSDNTENNNIDKAANQIEASVDNMGDKFNLDEVMMGDAPIASLETNDTKPIKNAKKITPGKPIKNQPKQMRKLKTENREEIMLGDQPAEEILPHVKKVMSEDLKKPEEIVSTPKTMEEIPQTTTEIRSRRETENPAVKLNVSATTATTESNIKSEADVLHAKGSHKEISRDHFIPPMLLVQHLNSTAETEKSTTFVVNATKETPHEGVQTSSTQLSPVSTTILNDETTIGSSIATSSSILTTIVSAPTIAQEATTSVSTTVHVQMPHEHPKSNMMRPHAPKFGGEISYHAPNIPISTKASIDSAPLNQSNSASENGFSTEPSIIAENITNSAAEADSSTVKSTEQGIETTQTITESATTTVTEIPHLEVAKRSNSAKSADAHQHKQEQQHKTNPHKQTDETNAKHADFTNANVDYQPYKPNRKRILTKPETHTYIQKIFG